MGTLCSPTTVGRRPQEAAKPEGRQGRTDLASECPTMNEATLKLSRDMQSIAGALDQVIADVAGERIGFTLIVFTEGRASYISTISREESVREIRKLLDLWDQGMPDVPAHDVKG
jgi:hypothetical protein